jgi:hypothetical protein
VPRRGTGWVFLERQLEADPSPSAVVGDDLEAIRHEGYQTAAVFVTQQGMGGGPQGPGEGVGSILEATRLAELPQLQVVVARGTEKHLLVSGDGSTQVSSHGGRLRVEVVNLDSLRNRPLQ